MHGGEERCTRACRAEAGKAQRSRITGAGAWASRRCWSHVPCVVRFRATMRIAARMLRRSAQRACGARECKCRGYSQRWTDGPPAAMGPTWGDNNIIIFGCEIFWRGVPPVL